MLSSLDATQQLARCGWLEFGVEVGHGDGVADEACIRGLWSGEHGTPPLEP